MSKGAGLATLDQFSIPQIISTIDEQIKALGKIETTKYKTNMNLQGFGDLKQAKDVETLVRAHSMVAGKQIRYNESVKALNLGGTAKPFNEGGYTLEEWTHDLDLQVQILTHSERLTELKKIKKEAEQFVSEEDKKRMFFEGLMKNPVLGGAK